jgi:hypothetical protein
VARAKMHAPQCPSRKFGSSESPVTSSLRRACARSPHQALSAFCPSTGITVVSLSRLRRHRRCRNHWHLPLGFSSTPPLGSGLQRFNSTRAGVVLSFSPGLRRHTAHFLQTATSYLHPLSDCSWPMSSLYFLLGFCGSGSALRMYLPFPVLVSVSPMVS